MEKRTGTNFLIIYSSVVLVCFCYHINAAQEELNKSDSRDLTNENIERKRREIDDLDELKSDEEKRQREFIGKRFRDFLGKRSDDFDTFDIDDGFQDGIETNKRFRHFLGKRQFEGFDNDALQLPDKRLREFIGKRSFTDEGLAPEEMLDEPNYASEDVIRPYDKRLREFVGKRSYRTIDLSALEKRLRDIVGKRDLPYLRIGQNLFFRKPKYIRELVGKRSAPVNGIEDEKRLREFIGKRMREFIGKRESLDLVNKRLREFIGK